MPRVPARHYSIFDRIGPVISGFRDGVVHPNCIHICSGDDKRSSDFFMFSSL